MKLIDKNKCEKRGLHNTRIFTSAMPYKRFCFYCMTEIKEETNKKTK